MAGRDSSPTIMERLFKFGAKIWHWITRTPDSDAVNRPYFAHFYNPLSKPEDRGLSIVLGTLKFKSALQRMDEYWKLASGYYQEGDLPRAFTALGHITHLVQDLHVPAHVHNDPHGPGDPDSLEKWSNVKRWSHLEEWARRSDWPAIERPPGESNVSTWTSKPITPPEPNTTWTKDNLEKKLLDFVTLVTYMTRQFRSVDAKGVGIRSGQDQLGALSDDDCHDQASVLIPEAIKNSAKIIANFLAYHRREYPNAEKIWLAKRIAIPSPDEGRT
jgi:hypothetical protein